MNKHRLFVAIVTVVCVFSFCLALSQDCFARSCSGADTVILECGDDNKGATGFCHILDILKEVLTIGIGILGVIGILFVGVQYLTAGGNEEKVRKSKKRMFHIIIGLVFYVLMVALANFLLPGGTFCGGSTTTPSSDDGGSTSPPVVKPSDGASRDPSEVLY